MYRLSLVVIFILTLSQLVAQNPHGEELTMDCALCHTPNGWTIDFKTIQFDHDITEFNLEGTHNQVDCKLCHPTLVFDEAPSDCISCHDDIHSSTVGNDCVRCHTPETWLVDIIPELHEENGFPLIGAHSSLSCDECHISDTYLRFDRLGNECINCHQDDYLTTENPNHQSAGYSTDCLECHSPLAFGWVADGLTHGFFPLTLGHDIQDCKECHTTDNFSDASPDCVSCHQDDYNATTDPNHNSAGFSTDCASCHSVGLEWTPATFDHDDQFFPIYSGEHDGEWNDCNECHTNPSNYAEFTCIGCHTNPETDEDHNGVDGYVFENNACLACHPNGKAGEAFDHSSTNFMLTGGHFGVDCIECHSTGYVGTSMICNDCHNAEFLSTSNPNHNAIGITVDCIECHTTDPGWIPATFPNHNDYYQLNGAHAIIANDCASCHEGDYNNTPNTCIGCHQDEYNNTTNPNHLNAQFPTECIECHTEDDWIPATFDHDGQYFPIYSGDHEGEWSDCIDCHTNPSNYMEVDCISCHDNPDTDDDHDGISGYVYASTACLACHPTGSADEGFDHNTTNFMLTGGHFGVDCIECHANGYVGTSMVCNDCHNADFLSTTNPNHNAIGIPVDCIDCHTTDPGWIPATFANHNDYYQLNGAHSLIANDCATCHNGDYNNTPNTCVACHQTDYDNTTDPNHVTSQFPTDCAACHGESDWLPASFDHSTTSFMLTGGHFNVDCIECHADGYTGTSTLCNDCHNDTYSSTSNPNHNSIGISTDCVTCHTTDPGWIPASFDVHDDYYQLNGAHAAIATDCATCHNGDYNNTPNTCFGCHEVDYNNTTDPSHAGVFNTDCATCHTESAWEPSTFDHDGQYFQIDSGTHQGEWNDCTECHTNSNNYAEYTCFSCHDQSVLNAIDDHEASTEYAMGDCTACHQ